MMTKISDHQKKEQIYRLKEELLAICSVESSDTKTHLERLKQEGVDLFFDNCEALQTACILNNYTAAQYLIEQNSDINCNNGYCLTWSSYHGHLDIVKLLIAHHADIHIENESPLFFAIDGKKEHIIEFLLESGANINALNQDLFKPILKDGHIACLKITDKDIPILKTLYSHGYSLGEHANSNLYYSLLYFELELATYLLDIGANPIIDGIENIDLKKELPLQSYELYQYYQSKRAAEYLDNILSNTPNVEIGKPKI